MAKGTFEVNGVTYEYHTYWGAFSRFVDMWLPGKKEQKKVKLRYKKGPGLYRAMLAGARSLGDGQP